MTQEENLAVIAFWSQNPNELFLPAHVTELFPMASMTYNQQLNALTRLILVMTVFGLALSHNTQIVCGVCALTLLAIFLLHWANARRGEGFELSPQAIDALREKESKLLKAKMDAQIFQMPTPSNPLSNVMMQDFDFNPNKKPALPAAENGDQILESAKSMVAQINAGQPSIADKLFADLACEFDFEQSMRPFYSTASSTIPNDQDAFAQFCYGSMVSCKEGNLFACARDNPQYRN